jgi:hypothetical protein
LHDICLANPPPGAGNPVAIAFVHCDDAPRHARESVYISAAEAEANAELMAAAPDMLDMLYEYANECAECGGTAEVFSSAPDDENAYPCPDCEHIWKLIKRAAPNGRPKAKKSQPAKQEVDDDIAF